MKLSKEFLILLTLFTLTTQGGLTVIVARDGSDTREACEIFKSAKLKPNRFELSLGYGKCLGKLRKELPTEIKGAIDECIRPIQKINLLALYMAPSPHHPMYKSIGALDLKCSKFLMPKEFEYLNNHYKKYNIVDDVMGSTAIVAHDERHTKSPLHDFLVDNNLNKLAAGNEIFFSLEVANDEEITKAFAFYQKFVEESLPFLATYPAYRFNIVSVLLRWGELYAFLELPQLSPNYDNYLALYELYNNNFADVCGDTYGAFSATFNYYNAKRLRMLGLPESLLCIERSIAANKNELKYMLEKLNILISLGKYDEVLEISSTSDNEYILSLRALAERKKYHLLDALKTFETLTKSNNPKIAQNAYYNTLEIQMLLEDAKAVETLDIVSFDFNQRQQPLIRFNMKQGDVYRHFGSYEKALKFYEGEVSYFPYDASVSLGITYFYMGDYESAIEYFNKANTLDKTKAYAYYYLANAILQLYIPDKSFKDAMYYYDIAINLNPNDPFSYYYKGAAYFSFGYYKMALKMFRKSTKLDKYLIEGLLGEANVLLKEGDYNPALELFNKCLDLNGRNSDAIIGLGDYFFAISEYEKAKNEYEKAIEINPRKSEYLFKLEKMFVALSMNEEAKKYLNILLNLNPNDGDVGCLEGMVYIKKREYNIAENLFLNAFKNQKISNIDTFHYILHYFYNNNKFKEVKRIYNKAFSMGFFDDELLSYKIKSQIKLGKKTQLNKELTYFQQIYFGAMISYEKGNLEEAKMTLQTISNYYEHKKDKSESTYEALDDEIIYKKALTLKCDILMETKEFTSAIECYSNTLFSNTDNDIKKKLGIAYYMQNEETKAVEIFENIKFSSDAEFYYYKGMASKTLWDSALINKAVIISAWDNYYLAKAYIKREQYEEAIASLDKAISLNKNVYDFYFAKGELLKHLNNYKQAFDAFEVASKLYDGDGSIYQALGDMSFVLKKEDDFKTYYKKAFEKNNEKYSLNYEKIAKYYEEKVDASLSQIKINVKLAVEKKIKEQIDLMKLNKNDEIEIYISQLEESFSSREDVAKFTRISEVLDFIEKDIHNIHNSFKYKKNRSFFSEFEKLVQYINFATNVNEVFVLKKQMETDANQAIIYYTEFLNSKTNKVEITSQSQKAEIYFKLGKLNVLSKHFERAEFFYGGAKLLYTKKENDQFKNGSHYKINENNINSYLVKAEGHRNPNLLMDVLHTHGIFNDYNFLNRAEIIKT
jgi:tetratricopeptide (TPR) repeat protein